MRDVLGKKALEGVKIADFTWVAAGPITTAYLAQHGATVVRVESQTRVDNLRTFPPAKSGLPGTNRGLVFAGYNANKYSVTINLNNPRGIEVAKKLVAWADVFAENFVPGRIEQWGLGFEELRKINPSIIMFRSSPQGQTGPDARSQALGLTLQGLSGFTYLTGWPDRDPAQPWGAITDGLAPILGATALLAALDYRARTGKGQYLDLSQFEAGIHYVTPAILGYTANGRCETRTGNSIRYAAPHGAFRCLGDDRWCAIAVFDDEDWRAFRGAIGKPDWAEEPRFGTLIGRKENEAELNRLIEEWTIRHTPEEVMHSMQACGVSAGVVQNAADLANDPQLGEREFWQELDHPEMGRVTHRAPAFKLSNTPYKLDRSAPCLGEHTEYVCREFLGISDEEFVELLNDGALD